MGQFSKQLFLAAPVEEVWKVWVDVERTPDWVNGVQTSVITSRRREGKGLKWHEEGLMGKMAIQMDHEFIRWQPMKKTETLTQLPMEGTMHRTAVFKKRDDGTEVRIEVIWSLGIAEAMIGSARLKEMMRESFEATAARWKERVESLSKRPMP